MSVHNGERYLRAAVDSILNQTLADLEFIIIDDASTDGSGAILKELASRDRRVTVVASSERLGLTRALNVALARARGHYVARMDADDISLPQRLERQVAFLESHPRVGVAGSFYSEIDEHGAVRIPIFRFPVEPILVEWRMAFENPLPHPPILARRSVIEAAGGYAQRWTTSQDYALFTRLASTTCLANCPEVLFLWRRHEASVSTSRALEQRANALAIGREYVARILRRPVSAELMELLWRRKPEGMAEALRFVSTAIELCRRIAANDKWSRHDRRILKRTASRRLLYEITPYASSPRTWVQLVNLGLLNPSLVREVGTRWLRRLTNGRRPILRRAL